MEDFEDELDDIRIKLYEETKHMSPGEFTAHIRAKSQQIREELGITMQKADLRHPIRRSDAVSIS